MPRLRIPTDIGQTRPSDCTSNAAALATDTFDSIYADCCANG